MNRPGNGDDQMKVKVELSEEYKTPYAVIYTDRITYEVQNAVDLIGRDSTPLTARREDRDRVVVLKPAEVYMVRIEGGETAVFTESERFISRKRLYEIKEQLGTRFIQISKCTLVNRDVLDSVEAGFNGTMVLKLKNGMSDYVTRRYLPEFKKYLGL